MIKPPRLKELARQLADAPRQAQRNPLAPPDSHNPWLFPRPPDFRVITPVTGKGAARG